MDSHVARSELITEGERPLCGPRGQQGRPLRVARLGATTVPRCSRPSASAFPCWVRGVRPSYSSIFSYSISSGCSSALPLFLKYVSKGFWFSKCFCLQARIPTQTSAPGSMFFDPHLWGKTLNHVELSVLNTLWLENGNTFTAQREGR